MKKALFYLGCLASLGAYSQTSLILTNTSDSKALAQNDTVYATTKAEEETKIIFDLKNTSASLKAYKVTRQDLLLNSGATAYFCFSGYCYPDVTTTSPDSTEIGAGISTSQLAGEYKMLTTDLAEGVTVGRSIIKYTAFNIDDVNDKFSFVIKY